MLAVVISLGAIASSAPAALAEKQAVGQAVGGQNVYVDTSSIQWLNPHRVDFTYDLNTERIVSQADCPAGTWTTLPEQQVHRPQSTATTAMLQVVCNQVAATKQAGQAVVSQPQAPSSEAVAAVATTLLSRNGGDLYIETITIVDHYAFTSNLLGETGGQSVLKRESSGWRILGGGGGAMNAQDLTHYGVPSAIATALIRQHQADRIQGDKALQAFRQAWAAVHPATAAFLGYWATSGIGRKPNQREASLAIFPSTHANQVCIVGMGQGFQSVVMGTVSGKALQTLQDVFYSSPFMKHSGTDVPYNVLMRGRPGVDTGYQQTDDRQTLYAVTPLNTWYYQADTKQQLEAAGCTLKLPSQQR